MQTKKVAIINLKGGCAKTTTTLQLATMLAGKEDNLREQIVTLREEHAAELEKVRAEGFAQLLEVLKTQQQK